MIANNPVMDVFSGLDLKKIALLLDVDGTIVDIGPSPDEVQVSDILLRSLARLHELSDGAIALVSGRRIGDLDRLFSPLALPSIGGHGAEMRVNDGEIFYWAKPLPIDLRRRGDCCSVRASSRRGWNRARRSRRRSWRGTPYRPPASGRANRSLKVSRSFDLASTAFRSF